MPRNPLIALKAVIQLGPLSPALYALYRLALRGGFYNRAAPPSTQQADAVSPDASLRPLFQLLPREHLLEIVGREGMPAVIEEADEIVGGRFRMFGGEPAEIRLAGDWPLAPWAEYETGKLHLEGDIKFVWEPARFGWAFVLGRAYHLSQDEKYAEAFWKYFETFSDHSPPYLGPLWMNGQEAAIRLLALLWSDTVLGASPASSPARRARLSGSVLEHALRISSTLIYARSQNNNHLLTEAAALYTAGLAIGRRDWRRAGWRWFNWALQHQIGGYGEYIQHSANYHRLMMQTALWMNLIKQDDWAATSAQALARASHWLVSMLDPVSGSVPNLGANDGSHIFPLSSSSFRDFRPVAQAASRAFLRTQIPSGAWDEAAAWFGLGPAKKTYEPEHYLSDNLRGRTSWAFLRASRFRSRLVHMDQLHFDLWWRGHNIAQDAGTYLYNADPPWDNALVSTRVHNTVMVDGRDQMTRGGRFMTLDWFPAYSKTAIEAEESIVQRVIAQHKGYRGVRHQRVATLHSDETWTVEDRLTPRRAAAHTYRLHWLLLDGEWQLEELDRGAQLRIRSPHGWVQLRIALQPENARPLELMVSVVRAGTLEHGSRDVLPFEGWASPTYGVKIPALSLAIEASISGPIRFLTEFTLPA